MEATTYQLQEFEGLEIAQLGRKRPSHTRFDQDDEAQAFEQPDRCWKASADLASSQSECRCENQM